MFFEPIRKKRNAVILLSCLLGWAFCVSAMRSGKPGPFGDDEKRVTVRTILFDDVQKPENCFAVVSKMHTLLNVYERRTGDTVIICSYPVCVGKNYGKKQKTGDMRTPESSLKSPFSITSIENSSAWQHDFGDGRGRILSYGNWFLRLRTPGFSGIGIHGSTNNESSVPGRGSEGCVRLRDADIVHLKEHYAHVGMPVLILADDQDYLPFEMRALSKVTKLEFLDYGLYEQ